MTGVLVVAVVAPIALAVAQTRDQAAVTAASTERFQRQVARVAQAADQTSVGTLVLQPDQPGDIERVASMATYLTKRHGLTVSTLPVPGVGYEDSLNARLRDWSENGMPTHYLRSYDPGRCLTVMFGPSRPACSTAVRLPSP